MHTNDQIIRTILGGDINGADVCIEQCLWIDPHFLHLLKYAVVAEETECGVVNLNVTYTSWLAQPCERPEARILTYGILVRIVP